MSFKHPKQSLLTYNLSSANVVHNAGTPAADGGDSDGDDTDAQQHMLAGLSSTKLLLARFLKQLLWKVGTWQTETSAKAGA